MRQGNPRFGIDAPRVVLTLGLIGIGLFAAAAVSL